MKKLAEDRDDETIMDTYVEFIAKEIKKREDVKQKRKEKY